MNFREKIINGLYGCAVADAVGNPFEFKENIDPTDVTNYANAANQLIISDDTQMTMFGFEAIKNIRANKNVDDEIYRQFRSSYLDWYWTQTEYHKVDHGLTTYDSMYSVQAPGNTCLNSLYKLLRNLPVVNDSMGCGSVMRLLPLISLFDKYSLLEVIEFAQITGAITHKHKDNDPAIERYIVVAYSIMNNIPFPVLLTSYISELGEGWIAPECVDMAIWAYSKANTFDELLELSIAHDGDSDSVAAVAGSLWGLSGREVPQKYIQKLDALDAIEFIIKDMK